MAWGDIIETVVQESSSQWGSRRRWYDSVLQRIYTTMERTAEWGHSQSSAEDRKDEIVTGDERDLYRDVQVQRVGSSGQYWVVYVKIVNEWLTDPDYTPPGD
jgi:hypothetical protein